MIADELDAFGDDKLLYVLVNYHRSPLGAWTATLAPDGLEPVTLQATSAHDAIPDAMDLIEALSAALACRRGDLDHAHPRRRPAAWATLAAREGFADRATTEHSIADLITHG